MCPINRFTSSNFIVLYGTNAFWGIFSSAIPFAATWKNRHEGRAAVIYDMAITTISHITIHTFCAENLLFELATRPMTAPCVFAC